MSRKDPKKQGKDQHKGLEEIQRKANAGQVEQLKTEGNELYAQGYYLGALDKFSEAIALDPKGHILFSNRCGANLKLLRTRDAVADARACISLEPDWAKGYSRLGAALLADQQIPEAVDAYQKGLDLDPSSKVMKEGLELAQAKAAELKKEAEEEEERKAAAEAKEEEKRNKDPFADIDPVIGIDLGTTFSCVAVWGRNGVEIISDDAGYKTVPSFVGWGSDGDRLVGHDAKNAHGKNTKTTVYDVKRIIGQRMSDGAVRTEVSRFPFTVSEGDGGKPQIEVETSPGKVQKFMPEAISAMILTKMKQIAEKHLGKTVTKAVVTVPAYFNDAQRTATKNAGAIAGLDVLRIINEPTAAALAYGLDKKDRSTNILIFDLGGGTFDATILNIDAGIFEVKATGGDTRLGGEDFDNALVDFLIEEFKKKDVIITDVNDVAKLKRKSEAAKRELSQVQSTPIEMNVGGEPKTIELKREQFESLNEEIFGRTLETVKLVLKDAALQPNQIDDIVLVGGSTRVPKIQQMLTSHFGGRQLCRSINPDEAVAYGAAVQGAILSGVRSEICDSIVLIDVTPLTLGIEVEGWEMSGIIPRNTKIPCSKTKKYTTEKDYQPHVDVRIFEGERRKTQDNHLLGEFKIMGIERAKKNEPEIDVNFALDVNGILDVSAQDRKTKSKAKVQISNACKSMTPAEIARIIKEAEIEPIVDKFENFDVSGKKGSSPNLSALKPHTNESEYFSVGLFVLGSFVLAFIGLKKFHRFQKVKPVCNEVQAPLMHTV